MKTTEQYITENYDGKWVGDGRQSFKVGQVGFLVLVTPISNDPQIAALPSRLEMRQFPVQRGETFDAILYGFATSRKADIEALGLARLTEIKNRRGRVKPIWGDEAVKALDELAYPELQIQLENAYFPYEEQYDDYPEDYLDAAS